MDKIVICKQCGKPEYWGEMIVCREDVLAGIVTKQTGRTRIIAYIHGMI